MLNASKPTFESGVYEPGLSPSEYSLLPPRNGPYGYTYRRPRYAENNWKMSHRFGIEKIHDKSNIISFRVLYC